MMLSRVAESLYWMTRYMERAEDTARLINAVTLMSLDMPRDVRFGWDTLIRVAGLDQLFYSRNQEVNETAVIRFLQRDESNPSSILACITRARENTRTFREVLPWECWEWVNELYLYARTNLTHDLDRRRRYEVLQAIIRRRQSIVGLLAGTMSRDAAFQFLRLGRNVERADMTTRILDVSCAVMLPSGDPAAAQYGDLLWMNILKALSAYQMYRRYVSVHADSAKVIEFVLRNREFPRTVTHCLREMAEVLRTLPQPAAPLAAVQDLIVSVDGAPLATLSGAQLHALTDQIQFGLARIDTALRKQYFPSADNGTYPTEVAA
jgi:uncharacterized alpha-E superfamily protein